MFSRRKKPAALYTRAKVKSESSSLVVCVLGNYLCVEAFIEMILLVVPSGMDVFITHALGFY